VNQFFEGQAKKLGGGGDTMEKDAAGFWGYHKAKAQRRE